MAMDAGFFKRQVGPLPVWAWMGLAVAGLLVVALWQQNKGGGGGDVSYTEVPEGSALPTYVFQNYDYDFTTIDTAPPGGGRSPATPVTPPPSGGTLPRTPPTPTPTPAPAPKPPPATNTGPLPKPPPGRWVPVAKYTSGSPAWNSTIWGISQHYGIPKWQTVWNHPNNANLRAKRKKPEGIQPGDKVWVPG